MGRDFPHARVVSPTPDNLPGLRRRERFIELQGAIVDRGLKNERLRAIRMKISATVAVELQISVDRLLDVLRKRNPTLTPTFDCKVQNPSPMAPTHSGYP